MTVLGLLISLLLSLPLPIVGVLVTAAILTFFHCSEGGAKSHVKPPRLYFKKSALADYLLKKCSSLTEPFLPCVLMSNPHVQTMVARILPGPEVDFEREFYQLRDRGVIALDWSVQCSKLVKFTKKSPVVIIIPGFVSTVDNFRNLCLGAMNRGYRCVIFNRRGFAGCPLTTPKLQAFGDPSDLRQVVKYIRGKYPNANLVSVAYSTGSGLLLSYLGEYGSSTYLTAGVCISPGYEYHTLYTRNGLSNHVYAWLLLTTLKMLVNKHATALSKSIDIPAAMKCTNLEDFEESCFAKMNGCDTMEQYWDKNNPMRDVDEISIPFLAINSKDDPLCPPEHIPFELFKAYPNFMLVTTEYGGHDGFLEGVRCSKWGDRTCLEYLQAVMEFISNGERGS